MQKKNITRLFILGAVLLLSMNANAKKIRALFLGNSYTEVNNLPELIRQLALSAGDTLEYSSNTPGGFTFEAHSTSPTSLSLIAEGNWDFVILQEQSQKPAFPDAQVEVEVYPYARVLDSLIHESNPCATTLFYVTWGRKYGDAINCPFFPPLCTYEGMDSLLQLRYTIMAEDNNAAIAPVAMVWRKIRNDLPDIDLYSADESHPSNNGSFSAACAFYAVMFQKDPMLCTYDFSVTAADAATIKTVAKELVYDSLHYWNRFVESPLADFDYTISGNTIVLNNLSENADSYHWDFGDGNTDTDTNPSHTFTEMGAYEVTLTAQKGECTHSFTIIIDLTTTGIGGQHQEQRINIYPNPVTDNLKVQLNKSDNYKLVLTDVTGKIVQAVFFQGNSHSLRMESLPAGMYLLSIQSENQEKMVKKVIRN